MTLSPRRFRLVIALDRSEYAEIVLEHAIDQAARHDPPDLHFTTVVAHQAEVEDARRWLTTLVLQGLEDLGNRADWRSRVHILVGKTAEEIATLTADVGANLLVVGRFGTHGRKGSVTDQILAATTCPTLVVGLTENAVNVPPQCPACIEVRDESDGERWFCDQHTDHERAHFTALLPSSSLTHGGPLL